MSKTNTWESDYLKLLFQNIPASKIGDATGLVGSTVAGSFYVSLHNADPGEAGGQTTSETAYTNYVRIGVVRSPSGWTVSGTAPTQVANAAAVTFAACGATGDTITHFGVGTDSSGASGKLIYSAALNAPLVVTTGVQPNFAIAAMKYTED